MEAIFGKAADLAIGEFIRKFQERRKLRKAFESQKRRIAHVAVTNDIVGALQALRTFLIEHNLIDAESLRPFVEKWLNDPRVIIGGNAPNAFSPVEFSLLNTELQALKI